jgi:uncharacterized protein (TIGR02996 family)
MSLDDAFLEDIRAHPDDDGPRLVYADWLEDHGDPARAEFIRLQCELAKLAEGDKARRPLERRERQLLAGPGKAWRAPLRKVGLYAPNSDFRRGFLDGARLRATTFVKHAAEIFRVAPLLRTLALYEPERVVLSLAACPQLAHVCELEFLDPNQLGAEDVRVLAASPYLKNLRALDLGMAQVGDAGVAALAASPHLAGLTRLDLAYTGLGPAGARALAGSRYLKNLTDLSLLGDPIGDAGAEALAASANLAGLTGLRLSVCGLGPAGVRALTASPHLAGLTRLHLDGNQLGDAGVAALAEGPTPAALRVLYLQDAECGSAGAKALAAAAKFSQLRKLFFHGRNRIGNAGVRALAASPHLGRLAELRLEPGPLSAAAARALAGSPHLAGLGLLVLDGNVSEEARRILRAGLGQRVHFPSVRT